MSILADLADALEASVYEIETDAELGALACLFYEMNSFGDESRVTPAIILMNLKQSRDAVAAQPALRDCRAAEDTQNARLGLLTGRDWIGYALEHQRRQEAGEDTSAVFASIACACRRTGGDTA